MTDESIKQQFREMAKWDVDEYGCWVARGQDNGSGYMYGSFKVGDKNKRKALHRVAYEVHHGPIPDGLCVMHSCDNPSCVNPEHLSVGTRSDNTQDMLSKGRQGAGHMTLTKEQIIEISNSDLSSYKLAKLYPVSATQVRRIKSGARCSWTKKIPHELTT